MGLLIAMASPEGSAHRDAWDALGAHDPTRLSAEHEQQLVAALGAQGAQQVLIYQDKTPILRFLMHPLLPEEGTASLGFFANSPEADDAMLQEGFHLALLHMSGLKIQRLIGPMNGNTWFAYRLRVDQHPLQLDWEPQSQPRLQALLQATGFKIWGHYFSKAIAGVKAMQASLHKDWVEVMEREFTLRAITAKDLHGQVLIDLHRLSQIGFASNPLFVPLSFEAFARSYLQGKADKENFLFMAYEPSGRAVAFSLAFLEPAHAVEAERTLVIKTIATDPEYRRQGLSNALIHAICRDLPAGTSNTFISALVFQGLASETYSRYGEIVWEHQYVLMAKDLL